jgi:hypothetical protein
VKLKKIQYKLSFCVALWLCSIGLVFQIQGAAAASNATLKGLLRTSSGGPAGGFYVFALGKEGQILGYAKTISKRRGPNFGKWQIKKLPTNTTIELFAFLPHKLTFTGSSSVKVKPGITNVYNLIVKPNSRFVPSTGTWWGQLLEIGKEVNERRKERRIEALAQRLMRSTARVSPKKFGPKRRSSAENSRMVNLRGIWYYTETAIECPFSILGEGRAIFRAKSMNVHEIDTAGTFIQITTTRGGPPKCTLERVEFKDKPRKKLPVRARKNQLESAFLGPKSKITVFNNQEIRVKIKTRMLILKRRVGSKF